MSPSPFCGLFSAEEFREYSYHADLAKFYTNGLAFFLPRLLSFGQLRLPFSVTERILVVCKELNM